MRRRFISVACAKVMSHAMLHRGRASRSTCCCRIYYSHVQDLEAKRTHGASMQVYMLRSFSDEQRALLLAACTAVIYTPQHEHFGIVPLEAMAAGRPVVACDSGGPRETVVHGRTGLLCEPTPVAFAEALLSLEVSTALVFLHIVASSLNVWQMREWLPQDASTARRMGDAARAHVLRCFSRQAFGHALSDIIGDLVRDRHRTP